MFTYSRWEPETTDEATGITVLMSIDGYMVHTSLDYGVICTVATNEKEA